MDDSSSIRLKWVACGEATDPLTDDGGFYGGEGLRIGVAFQFRYGRGIQKFGESKFQKFKAIYGGEIGYRRGGY